MGERAVMVSYRYKAGSGRGDGRMSTDVRHEAQESESWPLGVLCCPVTHAALVHRGEELVSLGSDRYRYPISSSGIPFFAKEFCSLEARAQEAHYARIAADY